MDRSTSLSIGLMGCKHHLKGSSENKNRDASSSCIGLKLAEAQKLYKYAAANSVTHEGIPAAIDDLNKALRLLHSVRNSRSVDCYYGVWKPERCVFKQYNGSTDPEEAKTTKLVKAVFSILNKVTSKNFDTSLTKIRVECPNIDTEERLACVAEMFYEKAIKEPMYSASYLKMCQHLAGIEVSSSTDPNSTTNFRKLLLKKCQREFANTVAELVDIEKKKKEVEDINDESMKKVLEDKLGALNIENRKKSLEIIRLIGELLKFGIISLKVIHLCNVRLLAKPDNEVSLECLCRLLMNVGKYLEQPSKGVIPTSSVITQGDENATPASSISGRDRSQGSGVNPSDKKVYDRNFPLQQQNNHASLKTPKGLPSLEVVRDKRSAHMKRVVIGDHCAPPCLKMPPMNQKGSNLVASDSSRETTDSYFSMLGTVVNNGAISNRVRFMIQDVIDLRNNNWNHCRRDNNPKTFELFHQKTDPRQDQERENINPRDLQGFTGFTSSQDIRRKQGGQRGGNHNYGKSIASRPIDYGWNMMNNTNLDMKQLKTGDSDVGISLIGPDGRGIGALGRCDQGSMSQSTIGSDSSVRSQTHLDGPGGRLLRPLRETNQHVSKDLPASTDNENQIARKAHSVLDKFFTNGNMKNALLDLKEWLHPSTVSSFIHECLIHVLKRDCKERKSTGMLLKEMIKRNLFSTTQFLEGFESVLQAAEDYLVDILELWECLAQIVEPIFEEGLVNISFLGQLAALLNPALAPSFVAASLKELVNALSGTAGAKRLWGMSSISLNSILPGVDINAFVEQHKELEFVKVDSTTKRNCGVGKPIAKIPSALVYLEFQRNLEHFLRMRKRSTEEVNYWIQNQQVEFGYPPFIRAVATAVIENCINGHGTESKLNAVLLKEYSEVLSYYVKHVTERELQLLFAVEELVTLRQQPKGLIQGIFETLYDGAVVSEGGIHSWMNHKAPLERKGKAVALR